MDIEDRRALALEAERRAWSGETPAQICAALDLSISTYNRWAALFGFRLADRQPGHKMARAVTPSGVEARGNGDGAGGRYPSGRFMLNEGLGGRVPGSGRRPREDLKARAAEMTDADVLNEVRALRDAGKLSEVDRWLSAWAAARRRERMIGALEKAVQGFAEVDRPIGASGRPMMTLAELDAMSDEALLAYVESLAQPPQPGPQSLRAAPQSQRKTPQTSPNRRRTKTHHPRKHNPQTPLKMDANP